MGGTTDRSKGIPGGSAKKNPPANAGDVGSIPESGRFPGEGNGNPLQYSCLGNPMDRGAWWATVHGPQRVGHDLGTGQQEQQGKIRGLAYFSVLVVMSTHIDPGR